MENKEKIVLNEEQLNEANGGTVLAKKAVANDDELDSVCGGAGKRCELKKEDRHSLI